MQEKSIITDEYFKLLTQAVEKISASLVNIMQFTENLVPEDLIKYGLNHCIANLCQQLRSEYSVIINYKHIGQPFRMEETKEIHIYKTINALFGFIFDKPAPGYLNLSITQHIDKVEITLTDDGPGFNDNNTDFDKTKQYNKLKSIVEGMEGSLSYTNGIDKINKTEIIFIFKPVV